MSLLRQRATECERRVDLERLEPGARPARLVSATRSDSDEELNVPVLQAKVADGAASVKTEVMQEQQADRERRCGANGRSWGGWEPTCELRLRAIPAGVIG